MIGRASRFVYLLHLRPAACPACGELLIDSTEEHPVMSYVVAPDLEPLAIDLEDPVPEARGYVTVCRCGEEVELRPESGEVAVLAIDTEPDPVRQRPFLPVDDDETA